MSPSPIDGRDLLVVGDVHGMWDDVDRAFVEQGEQACVIFVGDFGDEDVKLVERVARLGCDKVVLLGNHDAWTGMRKGASRAAVDAQRRALGADDLGFGSRQLAKLGVAVVGARPFSWGGGWRHTSPFYHALYGVETNLESAELMARAADAEPGLPIVVVGHNGPRGLGEGRDAIYGRDFRRPHIDFGDPDLEIALRLLREERGRQVLLTVAGHMHEQLCGGGLRRRLAVDAHGTVHLNAAVVPRLVTAAIGTLRHYLRVRIEGSRVALAEDLWIDDAGQVQNRRTILEPDTARREQ